MFFFCCVQLLVDDLLVYNGTMEMSTSRAILPHVDGPQTHHTVVFSDDVDARHRQQHAVASRREAGDQDVQLLNDRKVVAQFGNPSKNSGKQVDQGLKTFSIKLSFEVNSYVSRTLKLFLSFLQLFDRKLPSQNPESRKDDEKSTRMFCNLYYSKQELPRQRTVLTSDMLHCTCDAFLLFTFGVFNLPFL